MDTFHKTNKPKRSFFYFNFAASTQVPTHSLNN